MSYWKGTHWVDEPATSAPRPQSRSANRISTLVMALGLVTLMAPMSFIAAASHHSAASGCSVNPSAADVGETYVVSAWGLPTNSAINIWVTADGVTTGRPLGGTPDGTFNLDEWSSAPGVTTYAFSGPTKAHMQVYASCTVSAY